MTSHRSNGACRSAAWRSMLLAWVLMLMPVVGMADVSVADVPNVRLKDASQYVSDSGNILSAAARDSINSMLGRLEKSTGIETAVVMMPTIGDADIFDFAHELFRSWGIGKKKSDNGLLILFVMDQHKVRFTTGYGLEGTMTDAMSKRIQMQQMVPAFKRGEWDKGMVDGVRAAVSVLDGSMQPDAPDDDGDDDILAFTVVLIAIIVMAGIIVAIGSKQKCPKCGKKGMRKTSEKRMTVNLGRGRRKTIIRTTYVCPNCGHVITRDDEQDDDNGLAAGAVLGAMLGGSGGGGGLSGGSFGGGSTGGGGSTSGW